MRLGGRWGPQYLGPSLTSGSKHRWSGYVMEPSLDEARSLAFSRRRDNVTINEALSMGHVTGAKCSACGYSKSVSIGGGMLKFREFSTWPVFCDECKTMTSANVMVQPLACLECASESVTKYDADHLVRGGSKTASQWSSDRLTDGDYFCPQCKTYNLHFSEMPLMLFD